MNSALKSILFSAASVIMASSALAHGGDDLVKVCKVECPKAKANKDVHACLEKLEKKGDSKIRESACYKAHAEHEREEKTHGSDHGHSEDGHRH